VLEMRSDPERSVTMARRGNVAPGGQPSGDDPLQAEASRSRMLKAWYALPVRTPAASWWVAKAGPEHYSEHFERLREWVALLHARRAPDAALNPKPAGRVVSPARARRSGR
jgi:hypothetical protein